MTAGCPIPSRAPEPRLSQMKMPCCPSSQNHCPCDASLSLPASCLPFSECSTTLSAPWQAFGARSSSEELEQVSVSPCCCPLALERAFAWSLVAAAPGGSAIEGERMPWMAGVETSIGPVADLEEDDVSGAGPIPGRPAYSPNGS